MVISQVTTETGIRKINAEFLRYQNQIGNFSNAVRVEIKKKKTTTFLFILKKYWNYEDRVTHLTWDTLFGLE